MLTVAETEQTIAREAPRYAAERIPLAQAPGRVLRENIAADRDLPPYDRATMDGIALASATLAAGAKSFRVAQVAAAGQPRATLTDPNACIRIMTGAVIPEGCDTVVPFEDLDLDGTQASMRATATVRPGQHVHARGTDRRRGDLVLRAGCIIRAPQVAILAALGHAEVQVGAQPAVSIISTGDELVPLDKPVADFQIRPANSYGIEAALRARGWQHVDQHFVRDNPDDLAAVLRACLERTRVVLLSGGVSKGDFDYVPKALEQAGIRRVLHGVSQRPGKPLWFGTSPTGHAVFGLPGNPVSSLICFHRYVLPQLYRSMGAPPPQPAHARLAVDMTPLPQLTLFAPARIQPGSGGLPDALPQTYHGSGDYSSLGESHGFVELERGSPIVHAGTVVRYHGWADTYAESHQP